MSWKLAFWGCRLTKRDFFKPGTVECYWDRDRLADQCEYLQAGGGRKELKNLARFSTRMGCRLFWQDWTCEMMKWKGEWQKKLFELHPMKVVGKLYAKELALGIELGHGEKTKHHHYFFTLSYSLIDLLCHFFWSVFCFHFIFFLFLMYLHLNV